MKKIFTPTLLLLIIFNSFSQKKSSDYEFGIVPKEELEMTVYEKDTTANAVVLYEQCDANFVHDNNSVIIQKKIYKKIKILNKDGFKYADIRISLYNNGESFEEIKDIKGITYNKNEISKLENVGIFETRTSKNYSKISFTLPQIQKGSVIEYSYTIESPFDYKFTGWQFQSSIPKIESVFKAKIPGYYLYNRKLLGYLKLFVNDAGTEKDCFYIPNTRVLSDCETLHYAMKDIPAFIEEDYMTAKKNFISRISFELSERKWFNGGMKSFSTTWQDVDKIILNDEDIGGQLKRKKSFQKVLPSFVYEETDYIERAKKIYNFIQNHYTWNKKYWNRNTNIKRAYKENIGAVDEINLSLINALKAGGIDAKLVLISTRAHGVPTKLHPVITDFNYIASKISYDGKSYFLDATDKSLPFGVLPERCLNGDARVMDFKNGSYWEKIEPVKNSKQKTTLF